jgi:hypothetical protein
MAIVSFNVYIIDRFSPLRFKTTTFGYRPLSILKLFLESNIKSKNRLTKTKKTSSINIVRFH